MAGAQKEKMIAIVRKIRAYSWRFRFWLVLVIMLDTIRHLFYDTRPIDIWMLVVELLVLLIIGIEGGLTLFGWLKRRDKVAKVSELMVQGQHIQSKAPVGAASPETIQAWVRLAEGWEQETSTYLRAHSARATATFLQDVSQAMMSVGYNRVNPDARVQFERFSTRLINLRSIMEKSEIYF